MPFSFSPSKAKALPFQVLVFFIISFLCTPKYPIRTLSIFCKNLWRFVETFIREYLREFSKISCQTPFNRRFLLTSTQNSISTTKRLIEIGLHIWTRVGKKTGFFKIFIYTQLKKDWTNWALDHLTLWCGTGIDKIRLLLHRGHRRQLARHTAHAAAGRIPRGMRTRARYAQGRRTGRVQGCQETPGTARIQDGSCAKGKRRL